MDDCLLSLWLDQRIYIQKTSLMLCEAMYQTLPSYNKNIINRKEEGSKQKYLKKSQERKIVFETIALERANCPRPYHSSQSIVIFGMSCFMATRILISLPYLEYVWRSKKNILNKISSQWLGEE